MLVFVISIILAILAIVMIALILVIYNVYFKNLYNTSRTVIDNIAGNKKTFPRFPKRRVQEFEEMNYALDKTEKHLNRSIVYS